MKSSARIHLKNRGFLLFFTLLLFVLPLSWAAAKEEGKSERRLDPPPVIQDAPSSPQTPERIARQSPEFQAGLDRERASLPAGSAAEIIDAGPPVIEDNLSVGVLEEEKEIEEQERNNLRSDTYYIPSSAIDDSSLVIVIYRSERRLRLFRGTHLLETYPVALGRKGHRTPLGTCRVISKVIDPHYVPRNNPDQLIPPGPKNPVGSRWIGLSWDHYGIHGTNDPARIGQAVSLGCIRMHNADVEKLYKLISIGTKVEVVP